MATLIPSSNVEAAYEDMFKEITRKLYGEETGNGLHTLGTPVAQVATTGPTAPEGERSFTNLQIDRSSAPTIEYEHNAGAATAAAAAAAAAAAGQNTNVVIQQQPEGSVVVATTGGNFKSEDHLSTAFGLAALMQNGFATTGTILSTQAINKVVTNAAGQQQQQQQQSSDQQWRSDASTAAGGDQQQQQQQQQPQIVQWTTGGKLQSYTTATQQQQQQQQQQQHITTPKSKSKNRNDHSTPVSTTTEVIYASPSTSSGPNQAQQQTTPPSTAAVASTTNASGGGGGSRKKSNSNNSNNNQNANNGGVQIQKRYGCTHCPYSTDRRDLYTRHENIHKDEKPFQCYACLKQFNRADHVKKHFLRMHREMQYDINKTRRHLPNSSTGNHHAGGRGNVTITTINTQSNSGGIGSPEQKPNIFQTSSVQQQLNDNAFLEGQRQPTSSSLSIAETIEAVATAADAPLPQMKQEKCDDVVQAGGSLKPKREKRFTCCYCPWSGADKWGLKRHLNTHTKPFVCLLCDYKAARSERLATHVLKVHNKRACNKCSFLADTQEDFQAHINEVHPHDNRPARNSNNSNNTTNNNATNNLNVLRTIGNTLVTNNQLNTFQNASTTTFGVGNTTTTTTNAVGNAGGSVTIYTTTTTNDNGSGNIAGGPLQEIIVNPTSMVGWRLSANGSLIPPHDLLTGGLPNAAAQKRGSERLFQYLEADGSDPEDYARLLKMDAISRNTASVAQDFHKAGGVHELKIPANHQLLFNNKLPSQWTTKEAAALLHSLSKNTNAIDFDAYQQQQQQRSKSNYYHQTNGLRLRQYSTGEDDENTPSSASSTTSSSDGGDSVLPMKRKHAAATTEQRKAMSAFLSKNFDLQETAATNEMASSNKNNNSNKRKYQQQHYVDMANDEDQENQEQLIKSSPAYNKNTTTTNNYNNNNNHTYNNQMKASKSMHRNNAATNNNNNTVSSHSNREHRLDLIRDNKENSNVAATFLTTMEYQNLNKIGTHFQNYVKNIINKYYAETPLLFPAMPTATTTPQQSQQQQQHQTAQESPKRRRIMSETEEYIEYLKNKEDITLTITPKVSAKKSPTNMRPPAAPPAASTTNCTGRQHSPLKRQENLSTNKRQNAKIKLEQQQQQQQVVIKLEPQVTIKQEPQQRESTNSTATTTTKPRKSIAQLATLLPLLADAASQQQYLAAPLDFSKKPATATTTRQEEPHNTVIVENASAYALAAHDKRSSRKQAQPKKIRAPPELVVAMLRDKYLNRMVDRKLNCRLCANSQKHTTMLVFSYHTKGSLALHRLWQHRQRWSSCRKCGETFKYRYSLAVHCRKAHRRVEVETVKKLE